MVTAAYQGKWHSNPIHRERKDEPRPRFCPIDLVVYS